MIVRSAPPEHYGWIAERATLTIGPQFRAIEAIDRQGQIAGMVGFDGWTPNAVSLHIALDQPIALRRLVVDGFGLAFNGCGRSVAVATVLSSNKRSIHLIENLGFRKAGEIQDGWAPGVSLIFYQMRRAECRFLAEAESWAA